MNDYLYGILNKEELFRNYKEAPYVDSVYNLLASLFIKLPFLKYKGESRQLEDLTKIIKNRIESLGTEKVKLVSQLIKMDLSDIRDMNTDKMFELIKGGSGNVKV